MPAVLDQLPPGSVYFGGTWRETAAAFDDVNPHTEQVFAQAPDATAQDMGDAITAARTAADDGTWAQLSIAERARCLHQLAEALGRRHDEIAELGAVEWGMTANEDGFHTHAAALQATEAATLAAEALAEESIAKPEWFSDGFAMREPVGVVGAITPWTFPHVINLQKVSPALVAGNTMVLKPSPLSPFAALVLAKVIDEETDIPAGVFNVVTTTSMEAATALTTDPRVDMLTFVGSAATAKQVGAACAGTIKRTLFELGGKSAAIYLDDADVDAVLDQQVFASCTWHAGQACILHSRLLVHRSRYADFVTAFAERVSKTKVGDPADPTSEMGPLINAEARERIGAMVDRAVAAGARLVTGGGRPSDQPTGFYYQPTVLADVDNRSEIAQEEVFGPVTCITPFDTEDEAVRLANDSRYGLVGTVFSTDHDRAVAVARRVKTGIITVNGTPPIGAFGGFKQSGLGREGGLWGIRSYTELKCVSWMNLPA